MIVIVSNCPEFNDYVEPLVTVLQQRGYDVVIADSYEPSDHYYIFFGVHNYLKSLPLNQPYTIVQLEQPTSPYFTPQYLRALQAAPVVWDFSSTNTAALQKQGINAYYVPLGRVAGVAPLAEGQDNCDIDVLFYGALNDHRLELLAHLQSSGLAVRVETRLFGAARAELLRRTKIILNLHYYSSANLEQLRIIPALQAGKLVISERSVEEWPVVQYISNGDELAASCHEWLARGPEDRLSQVQKWWQQVPLLADRIPWATLP